MCEVRQITGKVYGRMANKIETIAYGPAGCTTVIGYRSLGTRDRHGEDFEPILCGKDCVLLDPHHSHHACKEHVVDSALKFIYHDSDEIIPEWREIYPNWALAQADKQVDGDEEE